MLLTPETNAKDTSMADENVLKTMDICRGYLQGIIGKLADEQLLEVPEGANNNILWNLGHLAHAHAGLAYGPCDLPLPIPETYGDLFKGGTSPSTWDQTPDLGDVREQFTSLHKKMKEDYEAGIFDAFKPRDLMPGVTLQNIEQALGFNCVHEGVHIGAIISICNRMKTQ